MEIIRIDSRSRYYPEVIAIYYKWWSKNEQKQSISEIDQFYKNCLDTKDLPFIYGLLVNDTLIGVYEINEKDHIDFLEYFPYLANVYVKEYYRGLGYSRILIEDAIERVKRMGYTKFYLHSRHKNYYEKFGFQLLKEVETSFGKKRIFVLDLASF